MKKKIALILVSSFIGQSVYACEVFFTNNLSQNVTIVDQENPDLKVELVPGITDVKWGSKDQMAFFTAYIEGQEPVVVQQIECTPTKEVAITTKAIFEQDLNPRYFVINPTAEQLEVEHDCGCGH